MRFVARVRGVEEARVVLKSVEKSGLQECTLVSSVALSQNVA